MGKKALLNMGKTKKLLEEEARCRAKVIIVSFPKSGRTWLRVLLGKALCERYGISDRLVFDELAMTEAAGVLPTMFTHDGSDQRKRPPTSWRDLDTDKSPYKGKKIIFLVRDPRDALVSSFFQESKRAVRYEGTISDFIRDDHLGIRKIVMFLNIWHASQHVPDEFFVLRYEDMHADPAGNLRKALDVIGALGVSEEIISQAVEFASFDNMRRLEEEDYFGKKRLGPAKSGSRDEEAFKVRKGKVGGFLEYLCDEDCAYINDVIRELGCPFFPIDQE